MKKFLAVSILSLLFLSPVFGQDFHSKLKWEKDYTKAFKKAKKQNKPILLFFTGSDWCGPCKMLVSDFFNTDKFANTKANKFVLYEADEPNNKDLITEQQRVDNVMLKSKYRVTSYPTIIILNSRGKEIGRKKGYSFMFRDPSYHFTFIEDTLRRVQ